jgi:hypothetical protein
LPEPLLLPIFPEQDAEPYLLHCSSSSNMMSALQWTSIQSRSCNHETGLQETNTELHKKINKAKKPINILSERFYENMQISFHIH